MLGISIGPPNGSQAPNPVSSHTMKITFGAPSGALGCSYGSQSGTESRMSMLMMPLNGFGTADSCVMSALNGGASIKQPPTGHQAVTTTSSPGWNEKPPARRRQTCSSRPSSCSRWTAWLREETPSLR